MRAASAYPCRPAPAVNAEGLGSEEEGSDTVHDSICITHTVGYQSSHSALNAPTTLSSRIYLYDMRRFEKYHDRNTHVMESDDVSAGARFLECGESNAPSTLSSTLSSTSSSSLSSSAFVTPTGIIRLITEHSSVRMGPKEYSSNIPAQQIISAAAHELTGTQIARDTSMTCLAHTVASETHTRLSSRPTSKISSNLVDLCIPWPLSRSLARSYSDEILLVSLF